MRKKTSKKLALIIATALSITMATSPAIQAATIESSQAEIEQVETEATSEFFVDDTSSEEEATTLNSLENQQNIEPTVETTIAAEEQTEETTEEEQIAETDKLEQTTEINEEEETTEIDEVEQVEAEETKNETLEDEEKNQNSENSDVIAEEENIANSEMEETTEELDTIQATTSEQKIAEGTCGENLTWYLTDTGKLYVNGTGKMDDYRTTDFSTLSPRPNEPWVKYHKNIKEIYLSDGITSIGDYAFNNCIYLSKITIPDSVTSIGVSVFFYCENLSEINLSKNLTYMGAETFYGCSSLSEIIIPEGVTSIGGFQDCSSLSKITLPENIIYIEPYAFSGCSSLNEITIPEKVRYICSSAFEDCSSLSEITIPESVTVIENEAFSGCNNLSKISILNPACTIRSVSWGPEDDTTPNSTLSDTATIYGYNNSTAQTYAQKHNRTFKSLGEPSNIEKKVVEGTCGKNLTWYLTSVGKLCINGTGKMDDFPKEQTEGIATENTPWKEYTQDIKEVSLSDGITHIGEASFVMCDNLNKITIPKSVISIGDWAFWQCNNLNEITLPESITSIGDYAFFSCESLSEITLPESITSIGMGIFEFCSKLSKINIPEGITSINQAMFDGCFNLSEITLPESITSIEQMAFCECSSLNKITLPKNLTSIGDWAFSGCSSLSEITIPQSVANIGEAVFNHCSKLNKITILNKTCKISPNSEYGEQTISNTATIYGYTNSTAQAYAKKYNRKFKALDTQANTYTITYNANGGKNAPASQTKEKDKTLTLSKTKPTRTGYTFLGWATSKTSTKATYTAGASFKSNKDTTLYAVWKANTYKIAFKSNGGTGSMATISCTYGKSYTLKANTFKRTGYTFKGWNTKADGTGMYSYGNKATVKNVSSVAGKTMNFYAQWTPNKYTITYQLNGGKNNKSNPASYKITNSTITLKNPTRKGYTFAGWYTSSSYKTKVTKITKGSTGNKTLYAKWTANKYKVAFHKNGGTGSMATISCTYDKTFTLKANTFKKKGYTFKGWNTKPDGTGTYSYANKATVKNVSSVAGKTMTLFAQWTPNKYTLRYDGNGATSGKMSDTKSCAYNKTYTLRKNTFVRKGYTFVGWAKSPKGALRYKDAEKVTNISSVNGKIVTLYAVWKKNV